MHVTVLALLLWMPLIWGAAARAEPTPNEDSDSRPITSPERGSGLSSAGPNEEALPEANLAAKDDWEEVKTRLSKRRRQLFEERPEPEVKKLRALELRALIPKATPPTARGELPRPEGEALPKVPARTPEEQSEFEKSEALRSFRIERKSDFEEELQDFLDAR
jgi:hypothetical protein